MCVLGGLGEKLATASSSNPADDIYPKMMSGRAIGLNGEAGGVGVGKCIIHNAKVLPT